MERRMTFDAMMDLLRKENISTWFDLGLFIDKFVEEKPIPTVKVSKTYDQFKSDISKGGVSFITFYYSIDGVTIEVEKYVKIFKKYFNNVPIHYIAGEIFKEADEIIDSDAKRFVIPEIQGFNKWNLFEDFFDTKLERGSKEYNELIIKFWEQTLIIIEKLGKYIYENGINLLYLINVGSNPGNVSLTLATILISEYLGIPVINNNHDFYWEGGNSKIDIINKGLKKGPRDFFFLNSDIGEFFSQIETLYPWESRSWINVNINRGQTDHLININGHNPANIMEIGTAVDTEEFSNKSKRRKIETVMQLENILSRYTDTLIGYSVNDVLINKLVDKDNPRPILITGYKSKAVNKFLAENIIFLQPTRIISRKKIEHGIKLIKKLFTLPEFIEKFNKTNDLKITILVTGPISAGHYDYFEKLIKQFSDLVNSLDEKYRNRIYMAFIFCEIDTDDFKNRYKEPCKLPDLYNVASLVLLPSKTEGRGLPIIESTACGTPIFCRRYFPEHVYADVIGEHLPEKDRLKVIEFEGKKIETKKALEIINKVFFPHKYNDEIEHNKKAVQKRYSLDALEKNFDKIFNRLYLQLQPNSSSFELSKKAIKQYGKWIENSNKNLTEILNNNNRQYLPGYGRLSFMMFLKSLIDPSYFRSEIQRIRGIAFNFANHIVQLISDKEFNEKDISEFYNAVDNIFNYKEGQVDIRHDHSFNYRHRNTNLYPYQNYTIQEISGIINDLFHKILKPEINFSANQNVHFFTDWSLAIAQLTSSSFIAIDDRKILIEKLKANIPIAYFPGNYLKNELEFFVLQSIRSRLNLEIQEGLSEILIKEKLNDISPVYLFAENKNIGTLLNYSQILDYVVNGNDKELKLLYQYGLLKIVKSEQICMGIHFAQVGEQGLEVLKNIRKNKGIIISNRPGAVDMTDIIDIDRIHIGKVSNDISANIIGIPIGSGFIQYVPAGIRVTLSYPTPVQTAKDFDSIIKSDEFKQLINDYGEENVWQEIKDDAEKNGSPLNYVLQKIKQKKEDENKLVEFKYVNGLYNDGLPWNGVLAKTNSNSNFKWEFVTVSGGGSVRRVTDFVKEFEVETGNKSEIAWNGGYILNAELVGKLGLPESYIGSPLGLLISDSKVLCPPLFNKPALIVYSDGKKDIKNVNLSKGFKIIANNKTLDFLSENYNPTNIDNNNNCYYDLLPDKNELPGNGNVIVRLAGNKIKEIIRTKNNENVKNIPVGITLSIPAKNFPKEWDKIELELDIQLNGYENIVCAVEAGPFLIDDFKSCINMEKGGWKTQNSINTQAARLDYTDMRGPKIAVGIDETGNLFVLTINGRIRESVGATHIDMANILMKYKIKKAMGFDPGGSSTLVVNDEVLNISPYNKDYNENVFALSPKPRAVANAVIGFVK